MAQRTTVTVWDDLEAEQVLAEHPDTEFGIDGKHFTIDLSAANRQRLEQIFAPFIRAARRVDVQRENGRRYGYTEDQYFHDPATGDHRAVPPTTDGAALNTWANDLAAHKRRGCDYRPHRLDDDARLQPVVLVQPVPAAERRTFPTERDANAAIREWGREQGLTVTSRGAISRDLRQMYREAHGGDPIIDVPA